MATMSSLTIDSAIALRFPPFPAVPDGVDLVPFHAFKPSGIRFPIDDDDEARQAPDEIERDGLGIPTIPLRVKHAADATEKKKKRKKKAGGGAQQVQVAPEKPKTWWEVWGESENIRIGAVDMDTTPIDRLYQAGLDFKTGRAWPTAQQGIQAVWDIFRLYAGLLQQTPAPLIKEAAIEAEVGSNDTDSDSDSDDAMTDDKDENNRMETFLSDPELSMKLFFSSHFRERGLIWSEPRCLATPILVSFFLRFLIRNRFLPEYELPVKRALEVVELARVELPNSWKMGRALPDTFSDGCKGLWGTMQVIWVPAPVMSPESTDQPEVKRQKLDDDSGHVESQGDEKSGTGVDADVEMADADESNPAPVGSGWGAAGGGEEVEGWGATPNPWNGDDAPADAAIEDEEPVHELATQIWDASVVESQATWDLEVHALLPLLGPSALPLTHTTGLVEQSTRRIVRVEPPRPPRDLAKDAPAAEAVEEDLSCRLARLILAPWERLDKCTYEAGSDVLPPSILSTSHGAVVMEEDGEEKEEEEGSELAVRAHRPWKDEIAVLVDPKLTDILIAGMGIGAIWVEIVRDKEAEGSPAANKRGKKKGVPKYWYMEQLVHQLPSFYIDNVEEV